MEHTSPSGPLELLGRNVNDKTEKKSNLTYLSWAWAWAEALRADPAATWELHTFGPTENRVPYMRIGETAMVMVTVTMFGQARTCPLPVMDNRNKAITKPDAMDVNKAIMRCLAKAIGMHGLGLYIYAGEDLPIDDGHGAPPPPPPPPLPAAKPAPVIKPTDGADELLNEDARARMDEVALTIREKYRAGEVEQAKDIWFADDTCADSDERVYLWACLSKESALRRAIKDDPRSPSNQDRRAA